MEENEVIQIRKDKVVNFVKKNYNYISYIILAFLVYLGIKIRTSNLSGLKDITTGGWTLGPDLDPFLFLRWTQYIVEHGSLMANDLMRYVPLGFDTSRELVFHTYLMTWFHKIALLFGSDSVTHSAVLYPAFMFGIAMIAFFFMTKEMMVKSVGKMQSNIIALIATFFLSVIPALLPRTIAGIPEKEASSLVFLFLSFYFFLLAWNANTNVKRYIFAALAGLATAGMALVWGGYIYSTVPLTLAVLIAFVFGKVDKHKIGIYATWIILFTLVFIGASNRVDLLGLIASTSVGPSFFLLLTVIVDHVLYESKIKKKIEHTRIWKFPRPLVSFIAALIVGIILVSLLFGPSYIVSRAGDIKNQLVTPVTDRLGVTVAENRQPYFAEWEGSFGPHVKGLAITFWLFFLGSVHLFYLAFKNFGKERVYFTAAYAFLLLVLVFSRYSETSTLNGTNLISLILYALGPIVFVFVLGRFYVKHHKTEEAREKFKQVDFALIFLLSFFIISLFSARSAVRLIMMLVPAASIIVSYFVVALTFKVKKTKDSSWKIGSFIIAAIVIIATVSAGYGFYQAIKSEAVNYVPSPYTQQWQKAMSWVRNNTPENAVFGHWWDYGYWVQTIGERATVLDGGNAISYWNYFMGRYALTGSNEREALEFLYAHNTTHFLIDSTDIGKYSAFSTIGSDKNYDRASFLPVFLKDNSQTQERKNSSVFVYGGGTGLDADIIYEENGTRIFLPAGKAGLGAILVELSPNNEVMSHPRGIFVYEGKQYSLPLRYAYDGEFKDFGSGLESGIFIMPRADSQGTSVSIDGQGAIIYLSNRTVKSQLARLYLYKEQTSAFNLVHSEDDFVVTMLKTQGISIPNDILYFGGIRGPIRIWEIHYPADIEFDEKFLEVNYPEELRRV